MYYFLSLFDALCLSVPIHIVLDYVSLTDFCIESMRLVKQLFGIDGRERDRRYARYGGGSDRQTGESAVEGSARGHGLTVGREKFG